MSVDVAEYEREWQAQPAVPYPCYIWLSRFIMRSRSLACLHSPSSSMRHVVPAFTHWLPLPPKMKNVCRCRNPFKGDLIAKKQLVRVSIQANLSICSKFCPSKFLILNEIILISLEVLKRNIHNTQTMFPLKQDSFLSPQVLMQYKLKLFLYNESYRSKVK